jgi:hypothetical protein
MKSKTPILIAAVVLVLLVLAALIYYVGDRLLNPGEPTPMSSAMPTLTATDSHTPTLVATTEPTTSVTATPTPTPTNTPTIAVSPTPTPTLLPAVALEEPEDHASVACQPGVRFRWSWPCTLTNACCFELNLEGEGTSFDYRTTENQYRVAALLPGEYNWTVAVMHSSSHQAVSEEADWNSFKILPIPIVHSISPTGTVEGTAGVTVAVSGEHFTYPFTLTIGASLQAALVNSSTITATIPITLRVGEYPVIVENSAGEGESFASFFVQMPTPTVFPTSTPPTYPPPELVGVDIVGCNVTFHWSWTRELGKNEWFAVRVGKGDEIPRSKVWVREREFTYFIGDKAGKYSCQIAICPGDPGDQSCPKPLAISERKFFSFPGCSHEL